MVWYASNEAMQMSHDAYFEAALYTEKIQVVTRQILSDYAATEISVLIELLAY